MERHRGILRNSQSPQGDTRTPGETSSSAHDEKPAPQVRTRARSGSQPEHTGATQTTPKDTPEPAAPFALCVRRPLTQGVLNHTRPAYDAMIKTERIVINAQQRLKPLIKSDPGLSRDLKTYKKGRRATTQGDDDAGHYQTAVESLSKLTELKNPLPLKTADFLDKKSVFKAKIYPLTGGIRDTHTGLYAQLVPKHLDSKDYFLCFPGTGAMNNLDKQWRTNVVNAIGDTVPKAFRQAVELAAEIAQAVQSDNGTLTLAGHSLGGGIANYVGLKLGLESICFNPAPMGKACVEDVMSDIRQEDVQRQTHLVIEDDLVSDSKPMKLLHQMTGHSVPLVGKIYDIPKDHPEYPDLSGPERHQLDAFIDLYLVQRQEKSRLLSAFEKSEKKSVASHQTQASGMTTTQTTTRTTTTTTTTTTTAGVPVQKLHAGPTTPAVAEDEGSEETVKERRRQAAREEKKPDAPTVRQRTARESEPPGTDSNTDSNTDSTTHSDDQASSPEGFSKND